jgi:hypothetical protein
MFSYYFDYGAMRVKEEGGIPNRCSVFRTTPVFILKKGGLPQLGTVPQVQLLF